MPDRTSLTHEPTDDHTPRGAAEGTARRMARGRLVAGMPVRQIVAGTLVALVVAIGAGAIAAATLGSDSGGTDGTDGTLTLEPADAVGAPIAASFTTFDGETANTADYLGRPLVLNFFAEWCAPCIAEMPAFESVHQELGDQVAFLGLNLEEPLDNAQSIVETTGVTYDVGLDSDGSAFASVDGTAMPTTVLIDDAGTIVEVHSGALDADELRALIEEHLL